MMRHSVRLQAWDKSQLGRLLLVSLLMMPWMLSSLGSSCAYASGTSEAVEQTLKQLQKWFAREVAEVGLEKLGPQVSAYIGRYGDDGVKALRQVGPAAIQLSAQAGSKASLATRLLAVHGGPATRLVVSAESLELCARYGDDAALAILRHPGIAPSIIDQCGAAGVGALKNMSGQNARRFAMLLEEPSLAAPAARKQLSETLERYGDKACDFIWRNKVALASTTVATAFFMDPEPFLNGTRQLLSSSVRSTINSESGRRIAHWLFTKPLVITFSSLAILYFFRRSFLRTILWSAGRKTQRHDR